jgi:hypothetical protein
MPSAKNWISFLYVNIAFAVYIACVFYFTHLSQAKTNWPLYRCNPMYMFLADNIEKNFAYCIQSNQINFMDYLLKPLFFLVSLFSTMMGGFFDNIQIKEISNKIKSFFSPIIESVFDVFLNLNVEFQNIRVEIKNLIGKSISIIVPIIYIFDRNLKTIYAKWNGQSGEVIRSLGKCFHPHTNIKLNNGTIKFMKDIDLGDILEDGSIVESVLKIDNKKTQLPFYSIPNGLNGENILVTGSHLVFDKSQCKFVKVENYNKSKMTEIKHDYFSCLITDSHRIKINNEIFWDWEDHFIK